MKPRTVNQGSRIQDSAFTSMTSRHDDDVLSPSLHSTLSSALGSDELEILQVELWSNRENSRNLSPEVPSPVRSNRSKSQSHGNRKRRAASYDSLPGKRRRTKENSPKADPLKNHEKRPSRKKPSVDTDVNVAERPASDVLEKSVARPRGGKKLSKAKSHLQVKDEDEVEGLDTPKKSRRKRKTKEEKATEAMPIAARTLGLKMYIGAHVSSAKGWPFESINHDPIESHVVIYFQTIGVCNSVTNSAHIGYGTTTTPWN